MRISIALCTWNGAAFLQDQLASLAAQTRPPDELIVCDDASADESAAIVDMFAKSSSFPVVLYRNATRLGTVRNFERAVEACRGEIIFLCDQDDRWHPQKIARVAERFEEQPSLAAVFTNARYDGTTLWDHVAFTRRERDAVRRGRALDVLLRHNVVTGATLAFRALWRRVLLPFPEAPGMLHDQWIALVLAAAAEITCIDEPLIDYRRHDRQQIGAGEAAAGVRRWIESARDTTKDDYARRATQLELLIERLKAADGGRQTIRALEQRAEHLRVRATLPPARLKRAAAVLQEAATLRYFRYSNHIWSVAKDLLWKD